MSKAIYDRNIAYRAAIVGVASQPAIYVTYLVKVIALASPRVLFYHMPVTLLSRVFVQWYMELDTLLFTLGISQCGEKVTSHAHFA